MSDQTGERNPYYRHGLSQHPHFGTWYRMVRRCTSASEISYKNYGARGIEVCSEWLDPAVYIRYVETVLGPKPGSNYSIDRIDNDGDYRPGNIRWATRSIQNGNQRQRVCDGYPVGLTGARGIRLIEKTGHYQARIHRGREITVGTYPTLEEAIAAREAALA